MDLSVGLSPVPRRNGRHMPSEISQEVIAQNYVTLEILEIDRVSGKPLVSCTTGVVHVVNASAAF
jgi:hypothetical protein